MVEIKLSDLALANVEALASGEGGGNGFCLWRTEDWGTHWLAICDVMGVGYDCECGETKVYPNWR